MLQIGILLVATSLVSCSPPDQHSRWNIVLITLDTTRADRLGCYGYPGAETPALDALAREAVRYERCYAPVPLTLPSHASLMTGLTPLRHGVHDNGREALPEEVNTLAHLLRDAGYTTGAVIGAFVLDHGFGLAQGFDHYDDHIDPAHHAGRFFFAERDAREVTDRALDWWGRRAGRPAFLWVHYFDPHAPYAPPGFNPAFSHRSAYDAEITYMDGHLGRLLEVIKDDDSETLVILASDHGEGLGQHAELSHGLFTYDTTLRTPLLVRFPDRRLAGTTIKTPVGLVDVMPSVLDWAGLPVPGNLDGLRLPLVERTPAPIYFENRHVFNKYGWAPLEGIVTGHHKYIHAPDPEYYDLLNDPHEETNLFDPADPGSVALVEQWKEVAQRLAADEPRGGKAPEMTTDALAKLHSLGYVSGGTRKDPNRPIPDRAPPDPKAMIGVHDQLTIATSLIDAGRAQQAIEILTKIVEKDDPPNPWAAQLLAKLPAEAESGGTSNPARPRDDARLSSP